MNAFDYLFEKTNNRSDLFLTGPEQITFRELFDSCLDLASWIQKHVGTGKNILLISTNNLFFIKSYLSIIRSGNVCIPLDPEIEAGNFRFISGQVNPSLIFTSDDVREKLPVNEPDCITPEFLPEGMRKPSGTDTFAGGDQCAEIIYTSGSTGKPKGVMISHRNLIANTASIVEYLGLSDHDRMLVVLPFYYCYGLSLLHTHLRAGGSIVLNNKFIFLGGVINDLKKYRCTGFAGVPSHFQILLRKSRGFRKTHFPDLKYVTQAGGNLPAVFIDEFRKSFPGINFIVMYGQTEATARLSYLPPEMYDMKKGSVGKPVPGVELRVVNPAGAELKPGETGEVIARGENIMMGYYLNREATKKAIREGWLYTGDLGWFDGDGYLYLTARKKDIIKAFGKRVSSAEIESVIMTFPGVIDCTVKGIRDEILGEAIKAVIVMNDSGNNPDLPDRIRKHCAGELASYKVPSIIEITGRLHFQPTGKKPVI